MNISSRTSNILLQHKSKVENNSKGSVPPFDETDAKIAAMLTDGGLIKAGSSKTIIVKGTDCETRCISFKVLYQTIGQRFLEKTIAFKPV